MPLKYFKCPDGKTRPVSECLEECPRPIPTPEQFKLLEQGKLKWSDFGRCLALGHLTFIGNSQREWNGTASVTQLLKPTRLAYLEITKDYTIRPDDMAFMMYGTLHHRRLEIINKQLEGLTEQKLTQDISGTMDRLEPDELNPGQYKLIDYKLVGAFSVAKALGVMKGNEVDPDMLDWELQLNKYRMLLEADPELSPLFPVSRLLIQATIRDSGLKQMNTLGLPRRMPMIPVRTLEDDFVSEYFLSKDYALHMALEKGEMPDLCDYQGRWKGRRCNKQYCFVHMFCPEGAKINKVPLEV